ncbi:MAG: bifunctional nuclease family protein, partial [Dehalococcoidia bacterium]
MIELYIDSVRISLRHYQRVIVLKQEDTQKYLPIWIGADIAEAIVLSLQNIDLPRPLTHDLMNNLIIQMGGKVDSIIVSKLEHDTYFAQIKIEY